MTGKYGKILIDSNLRAPCFSHNRIKSDRKRIEMQLFQPELSRRQRRFYLLTSPEHRSRSATIGPVWCQWPFFLHGNYAVALLCMQGHLLLQCLYLWLEIVVGENAGWALADNPSGHPTNAPSFASELFLTHSYSNAISARQTQRNNVCRAKHFVRKSSSSHLSLYRPYSSSAPFGDQNAREGIRLLAWCGELQLTVL